MALSASSQSWSFATAGQPRCSENSKPLHSPAGFSTRLGSTHDLAASRRLRGRLDSVLVLRRRGRVAVSGVQSGVVMTSPHSGGGRGAAGSDRRSVEPAAPRTVSTWGAGCGDRVRTTTKRRVAPAAWNRLSRHDLADAWRAALLALACVVAYGALAWVVAP